MAQSPQQGEPSQFVNDDPFQDPVVEETHRTLKNDDIALFCHCFGPYGRNLVVCIDGTANQFSTQNTNIVELYSRLVKNDDQLTYYNSGIGTYVKDSDSWLSWKAWKQFFNHNIDKGFATNFKSKVLGGYQWLSENYRPGDRIFLFGFSRGAYQVRVIAGMIEKVGLLHKGNNEQIAFAYDLYTQTIATKKPEDLAQPEELCKRFKQTLSHRNARTHFVGAWDTVSAIGVFRGPNLPETTTGMRHVCAFRHALALDELRVKFLPEYANGGAGPTYKGKETDSRAGDVKEVWFAGSHSDIGGGNVANLQLDHFGPSLRWMSYEAIKRGLKIEPHDSPWESLKPEPSMNWFYRMLECFPISRLSYTGPENPPPLQTPRNILSGQLIHESVFDSHLKQMNYKPIALLHDDKLLWDEQLLREQGLIEDDPYIRADHVLDALHKTNQKLNRLSDEHLDALVALSSTSIGRQSITEFSGSGDILISALELECQRLGKDLKAGDDTLLIIALAKALNSFDALPPPPQPDATYNPTLWSILGQLYPKSSSEWFKFYDRFGPGSPACAIFIGIDTYQSKDMPNLRGCVADANDLASFCHQSLGLSKGQLSVILDERATRATIIRAISNLATNALISPDDPIIIFYAGQAILDDEKMTSIIPYDYPQTQSISSNTLNDLIANVAAAKGNNITLIMDCAHAGAFGSHPYTRSNAASHVLLAGCGKGEHATEMSQRGWFSSNLSKVLREAPCIDGSFTCTYQDVVKRLPVGNQTPQCIGQYTDRFLFSTRRSAIGPISHEVTRRRPAAEPVDNSLLISAGEIHGITKGATFKIQGQHHRDDGNTLPSFIAVVDASLPHQGTMHCRPQEMQLLSNAAEPDNAWHENESGKTVIGMASLIHGGVGSELSVAVNSDDSPQSRALLEEIAERELETARLKYVGQGTSHQLLMSIREGKVAFDVVDGKTRQRIPTLILDVESLLSALAHAAHFLWHLWRSPDSPTPKNLSELVTVEAWSFTGPSDGNASPPSGENLVHNGAIKISVREDDENINLMFKITNKSSFKLYAWVFAFDSLGLSVENVYKPPFINGQGDGASADPCLPRFTGHIPGHILFSDMSDKTRPWGLPPGIDNGTTYLKVFLSSHYTDLSLIERASPFDRQSVRTEWGQEWSLDSPDVYDPFIMEGTSSTLRLRGGAMRPYKPRVRPFWDCFIIPIHKTRETL